METKTPQKDAIQEAIDYGIDVTLLYAALKRTPTERLENLQRWIEFADELEKAKKAGDAKT